MVISRSLPFSRAPSPLVSREPRNYICLFQEIYKEIFLENQPAPSLITSEVAAVFVLALNDPRVRFHDL